MAAAETTSALTPSLRSAVRRALGVHRATEAEADWVWARLWRQTEHAARGPAAFVHETLYELRLR